MMMRTEELKARLCQLALKNMFEVSQKVFCKALSNRKVIDPATACFFDLMFSFMCVVYIDVVQRCAKVRNDPVPNAARGIRSSRSSGHDDDGDYCETHRLSPEVFESTLERFETGGQDCLQDDDASRIWEQWGQGDYVAYIEHLFPLPPARYTRYQQ